MKKNTGTAVVAEDYRRDFDGEMRKGDEAVPAPATN